MDDIDPEAGTNRDYAEWQDGPWLQSLFRPLLIAVVATSFMAGALAVLSYLSSEPLGYVLPLAFLSTIEGVWRPRQLGRPAWRDRRGLAFRLGELGLIIVAARLAEWLFSTGLPTAGTIYGWLRQPLSFFDPQFVLTAALLALGWGYAVRMTSDLSELGIQAYEYAARVTRLKSLASADRPYRAGGRSELLQGFMLRWAWGGLLLVILASTTRISAQMEPGSGLRFNVLQSGLPFGTLLPLICYFVAGFLLLSQARLAALRGNWYNEDIAVAPSILRRWQILGVLLVLLVAGVAGMLPLGSTTGLSNILSFFLGLLIQVFYFLVALILMLFGLLLLPFQFLFRQGQVPPPDFSQILRDQVPTQQEAVRRLPEWLGGAVFWTVLALVVGYLVISYLNAHGVSGTGWGAGWERLRYWWRARWARLRGAVMQARSALRVRLAANLPPLPSASGLRARIIRPGSLPPRERVRYFYLSTLRRAAQRGIERPAHKTPLEFVGDLRQQWPDADEDLEALTQAFVDARYDNDPIVPEQAREVQPVWRRLMHILGRRKPGQAALPGAESTNQDEPPS